MPVRNAASTVVQAIESICRQTCVDWEMIVVEDHSEDRTFEIVDGLARKDSRVRVMTSPGRGIVAALNHGLSQARGELVARMDADDVSHPERLAEQAKFLGERPDVGLVGCGVDYGGDRAANAGYALHVDWLNALVESDEIARNRFVESPLAHPSVMFRHELMDKHGGYREGDFPEDYELWLRWMDAGVRLAKVSQVLLTWHDLPGRLSRTDVRYDPDAFYRVKAEYIARELKRLGRSEAWVWGAGRPTRKRAEYLCGHGVMIAGYVDVDSKKTGKTVGGRPVIEPGQLPAAGNFFVLGYVASRGARELIRADLAGRGYREWQDFLMCA